MMMSSVPKAEASQQVLAAIAAGLEAAQASIHPKYFYDTLGSLLFDAICALDEYYPTRTEAGIFAAHAGEIAAAIGAGATLVDLGAGNCAKAASLFPLLHPGQYVPVDISAGYLRDAVERLQQRFPHIDMTPLALDFSASFDLPATVRRDRRLFFYPGSSIGNFTPYEAHCFLRRLRGQCDADGGVLIGFDLVKPKAVLEAAYDDALGVTAAFNLNILRHINRLAGSDFDLAQWRHVAFFNEDDSRIEMHLEARAEQVVHWDGGERRFAAGARIHTENSYKYTQSGAVELLAGAGFRAKHMWVDPKGWFALVQADVEGGLP
jgi:dimethylhistidine N-methyltransferase